MLRELNPIFVRFGDFTLVHVERFADAQGVRFDCPCRRGHRLVVPFKNAPRFSWEKSPERWTATGSSLEDLTLAPSVDAKCWHGQVTGGMIQ